MSIIDRTIQRTDMPNLSISAIQAQALFGLHALARKALLNLSQPEGFRAVVDIGDQVDRPYMRHLDVPPISFLPAESPPQHGPSR